VPVISTDFDFTAKFNPGQAGFFIGGTLINQGPIWLVVV